MGAQKRTEDITMHCKFKSRISNQFTFLDLQMSAVSHSVELIEFLTVGVQFWLRSSGLKRAIMVGWFKCLIENRISLN